VGSFKNLFKNYEPENLKFTWEFSDIVQNLVC
jgi:hypothetical protein